MSKSQYSQQFAGSLPPSIDLRYQSFDRKLIDAFPIIVSDPPPPPGGWKSLSDFFLAKRGLQRLGGPVVSVDTCSPSAVDMDVEEKKAATEQLKTATAPSAPKSLSSSDPTCSSTTDMDVEEKKTSVPTPSALRSSAPPFAPSSIEEKKSFAAAAASVDATADAVSIKQRSPSSSPQPTPPAPRLAYVPVSSSASTATLRLTLRPIAERFSSEAKLRARLVNIFGRHHCTHPQQRA